MRRDTKNKKIELGLLVLRCQAGDESAFRLLYVKYSAHLLRYLDSLLASADAKDVHQEVWLTVFRRIRDLADPEGFQSWLFRSARHRAIDYLRSRKRDTELLEALSDGLQRPKSTDIEEVVISSKIIEKALRSLPPQQREVLLLRYWEDMSYEEIATIVGCTIGTVRSRLHYAKEKCLALLSAEQGSEST